MFFHFPTSFEKKRRLFIFLSSTKHDGIFSSWRFGQYSLWRVEWNCKWDSSWNFYQRCSSLWSQIFFSLSFFIFSPWTLNGFAKKDKKKKKKSVSLILKSLNLKLRSFISFSCPLKYSDSCWLVNNWEIQSHLSYKLNLPNLKYHFKSFDTRINFMN